MCLRLTSTCQALRWTPFRFFFFLVEKEEEGEEEEEEEKKKNEKEKEESQKQGHFLSLRNIPLPLGGLLHPKFRSHKSASFVNII